MSEASQHSPLKLPEDVQRVLLSTTSRFLGVFETADVRIDHAWPGASSDGYHRWQDGPTSRSTYVLSFITNAPKHKAGVVIPDYSATGDFVATWLSLLFGKRVESHGSLANCGRFGMPELGSLSTTCVPGLPHNSHNPRVDFGLPLILSEAGRLAPIWTDDDAIHAETIASLSTAARFYQRGLVAADRDPEIAFLHMVTAGEILSQLHLPMDDERLLDSELEADLSRLTEALSDGGKLARKMRRRLFEVKRRFVRTFDELVDDAFFTRREASEDYSALQKDKFCTAMAAAYDLRSLNVHQGQPIGVWLRAGRSLEEVQVGRPIVENAELKKALAESPTLVGIERATRYALLRFAEKRLGLDLLVNPT